MSIPLFKTIAPMAALAFLSGCTSAPPALPQGAVYTPTQCGVVKTDSVAFLTKTCETQLKLSAQPVACNALHAEFGNVIKQAEQQVELMRTTQRGIDCRETIMSQIGDDMEKATQTMKNFQEWKVNSWIPPQCARIDLEKINQLTESCEAQLAQSGDQPSCAAVRLEVKARMPEIQRALAKNQANPKDCSDATEIYNKQFRRMLDAYENFDRQQRLKKASQ
ncbi:hypothetical protein Q1J52_18575 [Pseudomonas lijiangensis]|uniref:hypothetical protein n=1 Tax=Pseudomonas lijiangensis TaxID=2995658 RepID=UPI0034D744E9